MVAEGDLDRTAADYGRYCDGPGDFDLFRALSSSSKSAPAVVNLNLGITVALLLNLFVSTCT
jgi:hypothetical protein